MCQCRVISCKKYTCLVEGVNGEGCACVGARGIWEPSCQFYCEPKTALKKIKSFKKILNFSFSPRSPDYTSLFWDSLASSIITLILYTIIDLIVCLPHYEHLEGSSNVLWVIHSPCTCSIHVLWIKCFFKKSPST